MTRLWVKRVGNALYADGDESLAAMELLPFEKPIQADLKQPVSAKFKRLYFGICSRIGKGIGKDTDWVSEALKVETERYQVFRYGGKSHVVLASISKMDAPTFKAYFEDALQVVYGRWNIPPESIADILAEGRE